MNKKIKIQYIIIGILLLTTLFISSYKTSKSYAIINFDIKIIDSKVSQLNGQIYYSSNHIYHKDLMKIFILQSTMYGEYQTVNIPITHKNITSIRLDPLPDSGEFVIKNFSITHGSWFNKKIQNIDLSKVDIQKFKNIHIIKKETNLLHLRASGSDPHLDIIQTIHNFDYIKDYRKILELFIFSLFLTIIILSIIYALKQNYIQGSEINLAFIILLYSIYTFLYSTQFIFADTLIIIFPLLGLYIIYSQGIPNYYTYLKNTVFILIVLYIILLIVDSINHTNQISLFISKLYTIIVPATLISMLFIQKKHFNYHFYKSFLIAITIFLGIFSILLHNDIIQIDTIITYGYKMSMSPWAQKNYTFWYLFLMWGTISFLHFTKKNKKDFIIILFILFISSIAIFTGYSSSAKLAFIISIIIYLLFSFFRFNLKILMAIPILISLYILLTPWIADLYVSLADIHPRFTSREPIFAIYSDIIKNHLFFGYGFYNANTVNPPIDYVSSDIIIRYIDSPWLQKCVPHSVLLYLWLDFGLLGISVLTILIYISMKNLIQITYNQNNQAALIALITSFLIIISFSWGNWYSYALLTFSFFMGMIFLSLNINHHKKLK